MVARLLFLTALLIALPARATWSIVGVDPVTREVGVAVATCVPEPNGSRILPEVAGLAPDIGALAAQAQFNQATRDRALSLLRAGRTPEEILSEVNEADRGAASRQYGLVTLLHGAAHYTGSSAGRWAGAEHDDVASAQGNILVGPEVVDDALRAFQQTQPCEDTLADKLLRALEAGARRGGDSRCPTEQAALVAVLRVAGPSEDGDDPALNLLVSSPLGAESPVALLRQAYERHRASHPAVRCEPEVDAGGPGTPLDAGSLPTDAAASDVTVGAAADAGTEEVRERDAGTPRDAAGTDGSTRAPNDASARDSSSRDASRGDVDAPASEEDGSDRADDEGESSKSGGEGGCAVGAAKGGSAHDGWLLLSAGLTIGVIRRRTKRVW